MQIGVIGATGTIGSRIVTEALDRGHQVTAFSRDISGVQDSRENIRWRNVGVTDADGIAAVLPGLDHIANSSRIGRGVQWLVERVTVPLAGEHVLRRPLKQVQARGPDIQQQRFALG